MSMQQIKEEINELREEFNKRISEFENKLEQKQSSKRWRPENGENYCIISDLGTVKYMCWANDDIDNFRYSQADCFKTEEEVSQHLENHKTKAELRALAEELNGDEFIDWENIDQNKFYIFCLHSKEYGSLLNIGQDVIAQTQGTIYCLDRKFLVKAVDRIGEDRLIKMVMSGV